MSDPGADLEQRAASLCAPCSDAEPTGKDIRYDPQFEALQKEIGKLETPQASVVDWAGVERDATTLLQTRSKDILVLSWLVAALFERRGLDGLATGLWALGTTVEKFWPGMHPPLNRIKARASAVTWLVGRVTLKLEGHTTPLVHDEVERLQFSIRRLQRVVGEQFGENAPGLRPIADAVERLRLSLPARPEPAAAPVAAAPVAAPAPAAPPPPAPAPTPTAAAAPTPAAEPVDRVKALEASVAPLLAPIPGALPAGEDVRYDPEHEWLRSEIAKLENPAMGAPDWGAIVQRGRALLQGRAKDLVIASYVAWGLAEKEGVAGLSTGLVLLAGLVAGFWPGLHPARVKARAGAVAWLLTRVEQTLSTGTLRGSDKREPVLDLELAARTFATAVRTQFGEDAPGTRPLLDAVERMKMSLPAEVKAPPPPPAATPAAPPPAAAPPAAAPPVAAPPPPATAAPAAPAVALPAAPTLAAGADPTAFLQQSGAALGSAAAALRSASPADPTAYRLSRVGLYLAIAAPPPTTAGKKTGLRPPPPALRQQLQTLTNNGKWAALLDESESALSGNRFWLDLHRFSYAALQGLEHGPAAAVVAAETAHLARRFPDLGQLQFSDGSAVANQDTLDWIASMTAGSGGGAGPATDDPVDVAAASATTLAGAGKRDEALRLLQDAIRSAADHRSRFRLRLAMAKLCSTGAPAVARGLLEGLAREAESTGLDLWEPALAGLALRAYHDLLRDGAKTNPRMAEEAGEVYRRLCRIDVVLAVASGT